MRLRYTKPALADIRDVAGYLDPRSPQGAKKVIARIRDVADSLRHHPHSGKQTDDPDIRRLVAIPYPYLIFYQVSGEDVIIHAIKHAARDPRTMPGSES